MEPWSIMAERWPDRILEIRWRCAVDGEFRAIVCDYQAARRALDRWSGIDPPGSERLADFEELIREIEAEIEERLS